MEMQIGGIYATGSSKTYIACAFGMKVGRQYYTVKYVRLHGQLPKLEAVRNNGTFAKELSNYTKTFTAYY